MTDQTARAYRPSDYTDEDDDCSVLSDGVVALISIERRCNILGPAICGHLIFYQCLHYALLLSSSCAWCPMMRPCDVWKLTTIEYSHQVPFWLLFNSRINFPHTCHVLCVSLLSLITIDWRGLLGAAWYFPGSVLVDVVVIWLCPMILQDSIALLSPFRFALSFLVQPHQPS